VAVVVEGLRDVNAAFAKTDRDLRLGWRAGMRQVAEPVKRDASASAMSEIPRMSAKKKVDWSKMRVGVTCIVVYVAPRQKGTRGRGPRSRGANTGPPSFGDLLMDRAMQPALERHEHEITARFENLLDHVADNFNHG